MMPDLLASLAHHVGSSLPASVPTGASMPAWISAILVLAISLPLGLAEDGGLLASPILPWLATGIVTASVLDAPPPMTEAEQDLMLAASRPL